MAPLIDVDRSNEYSTIKILPIFEIALNDSRILLWYSERKIKEIGFESNFDKLKKWLLL